MSSTLGTITPVGVDDRVEDEEITTDGGDQDFTGWFCISTDPWPCAAPGCKFVAEHITAAHHIIVWQEMDDPRLLKHAQHAKNYKRNPKVVEYEQSMGPCLSYDQWYAMGRPVHAVGKPPL